MMTFKVVRIQLTGRQVAEIEKVIGSGDGDFALLAEPDLKQEVLKVQICTNEQFDILRPAILKAYELPPWSKKRVSGK